PFCHAAGGDLEGVPGTVNATARHRARGPSGAVLCRFAGIMKSMETSAPESRDTIGIRRESPPVLLPWFSRVAPSTYYVRCRQGLNSVRLVGLGVGPTSNRPTGSRTRY